MIETCDRFATNFFSQKLLLVDVLPCQCAQLTTFSVLSVARDFAVVTLLATLSAPLPARKIVVTLPDLILSLAG